MKAAPFSELEDGLPLWRVQVDDPQAAMGGGAKVHVRVLALPQGKVAAAVLELEDVKGKPSYHHICGAWIHPDIQIWFGALILRRSLRLRFEHAGWMSDAHLDVAPDPAAFVALATLPHGAESDPDAAVRDYSAFYREQFPRLKDPQAVWAACLERSRVPLAAGPGRPWAGRALAGVLAAALGLAAYFLLRHL